MIRTFKIRHSNDFSNQLEQCFVAACRVLQEKKRQKIDPKQTRLKKPSSAHQIFADLNLKSTILASVIQKYWNNKSIKRINRSPNVLFGHNNHKQIYIEDDTLILTPLRMKVSLRGQWFYSRHSKIIPKSVEINNQYIYLTCEIPDIELSEPRHFMGIDLNATGDLVVMSDIGTGSVRKFGKELLHIKNRYFHQRRKKQAANKRVRQKSKRKEHRITLDYCRKLAVLLVKIAIEKQRGLRLENLKGLRKNAKKGKRSKQFNRLVASFPFYLLKQCIINKCEAVGVPCEEVDARYTSKACSRCGCIGKENSSNRRSTKKYECHACGHKDHADSNAGFNISGIESGKMKNAWSLISA